MKKILLGILCVCFMAITTEAQVISPEGEQPAEKPQAPQKGKSVVIKQEGYETPLEEVPLNEQTFKQRLRIGGGISGLQFGNPTILGASPMLGYQATNTLILGLGGTYQYTRYSSFFGSGPVKISQLGYRAFAMQSLPFLTELIGGGFAQVEFEQFQAVSQGLKVSYRPAFLVGVGMSTGGRRSINLTALYDLNYKAFDLGGGTYSSNGSPLVLRIGGFFF